MTFVAEAGKRLEVGQIFAERYAIEGILGKGGMGAVYRARDLALGEDVALKMLSPLAGTSPVSVLRFRQEVKLSRRVTHPNVVRVYDIGEHEGMLYMTMELVSGDTLASMLRKQKTLPVPECIRIGTAICAGLSAAHAAGIVHRDLKPSNVLIDESGRVMLTDFGIARSLHEDSDFTQEGMLVGTLRYMAPEQLSRRPVIDARTDIYALALLLHEALTGIVPERYGHANLRGRIVADADVAARLEAILEACIAVNPAQRPSSVEVVAHALATISSGAEMEEATTRQFEAPADDETKTAERAQPKRESGGTIDIMAQRHAHGATMDTGKRSIAVFPFQYIGPPDWDYLGRTIADELVDTLAQIQGLRVMGTGATMPYSKDRDPRATCAGLGVALVLDGTLQMAPGGRTRTAVRLIDATGTQHVSERHDGTVSDMLTFQMTIARRIAERLRVEITLLSYRGDAPPDAIAAYLEARRDMRAFDGARIPAVIAAFERCLEMAPHFLPAVSGHAMACVRAWFVSVPGVSNAELEARAAKSVSRALAVAHDLAEAHLAGAMLEVQRCDFAKARIALERALAIAPTCQEALEYLGMLRCEAGLVELGLPMLEMAAELDPSRSLALAQVCRTLVLCGRDEEADVCLAQLTRVTDARVFLTAMGLVRVSAWRRARGATVDEEPLRVLADATSEVSRWPLARLYAQVFFGQAGAEEMSAMQAQILGSPKNQRAVASVTQMMAEMWMMLGESERALSLLDISANAGLVDVLWLDKCPLLASIRGEAGFVQARKQAAARAEALKA